MPPIDLSRQVMSVPYLWHEFGHLVVAKRLGFTTHEVILRPAQGGAAGTDLQPSIHTLADVIDFAEKRAQVLYAGVLAQSLERDRKTNHESAKKLLSTTASDDFGKVKELLRLIVGIQHPDASPEMFEKNLEKVSDKLWNETAKLVEEEAELIRRLASFFLSEREAEQSRRGDAVYEEFVLSGEKIDQFIAKQS